MDTLLNWDKQLFLFLNGSESLFLDRFFWVYTSTWVWSVVILVVLYTLFTQLPWRKALLTVLMMILVVTLCDQIASGIFKPLVARLRPTHDPILSPLVDIVNNYRGGRYGFMSSHAANSFGLAMFTALLFRERLYSVIICIWAVLNSYSRIYLGVHYPTDIIAGATIGIVIGWILYRTYDFYIYNRQRDTNKLNPKLVTITILFTWIMLLLAAAGGEYIGLYVT